jgi:chemotaxis protein CheX
MTLVQEPGGVPTLCLDEMLNLSAARPLAEALVSARGSDLNVSVANVRLLGAQCGQILVASLAAWRADGHTLKIVDATATFDEGVQLLGLDTFFSDAEASQ